MDKKTQIKNIQQEMSQFVESQKFLILLELFLWFDFSISDYTDLGSSPIARLSGAVFLIPFILISWKVGKDSRSVFHSKNRLLLLAVLLGSVFYFKFLYFLPIQLKKYYPLESSCFGALTCMTTLEFIIFGGERLLKKLVEISKKIKAAYNSKEKK